MGICSECAGRKISYEKSAQSFSIVLGGGKGGGTEVYKETDAFFSNRMEMDRFGTTYGRRRTSSPAAASSSSGEKQRVNCIKTSCVTWCALMFLLPSNTSHAKARYKHTAHMSIFSPK